MGFTGVLRYLLFIFNFALWLLGCAMLAVGIWIKVDDRAEHQVQEVTELKDDKYLIHYSDTDDMDLTGKLSYVLIVFGLVLIIVTCIGCCGAVKESPCLLGVFSVCLFVIMCVLISVGIWAHVKKDNVDARTMALEKKVYSVVEDAVDMYYKDKHAMRFVDAIQNKFKCCAVKPSPENTSGVVPQSCIPAHHGRNCVEHYLHFVCGEIEDFLRHRYAVIAAVTLSVGCVLAFGILLAVLLAVCIKRSSSARVS